MGIKIFSPGGVDQKSSHLTRPPEMLRDSQNVQKNIVGEYIKRGGTAVDASFATESVGVYNDVIYIKSLNRFLFRDGSGYSTYVLDSSGVVGAKKSVYKFYDPTSAPTSNISLDEYLNTAVFTHENGSLGTAVYDGHAIYRAGLPTPLTTITSGSGTTGYILTFFDFIDNKGNNYFGPATINPCANSGSIGISFTTLKDSGFCASYLLTNLATGTTTLSSSSRTISYTSVSADILAVGAKVVFRNRGTGIVIADPANPTRSFSDAFLILEVESFTGSAITFTAASFGGKSVSILNLGAPVVSNIHGGTVLRVFFSNEETTGYVADPTSTLNGSLVSNSADTQTGSFTFDITKDGLLSNFYDITTDKLRPPTCKYIKVFGYQIVYGAALSFWDFQNKETIYPNNDDLIMYSDTSAGDLGFNLTASNRQLIGETYDGSITGLTRSKDSLIVFKTRSPYAIDGVLIPGQYSLRKIETDDIGCVSFKSILPVKDSVLFQGQDGIYEINGYQCKKASIALDVFFRQTVTDPTQTRAILDTAGNKYLFFCDNGVAVYDYEFGEWYVWKDISAPKGITLDNFNVIRMFRAQNAFKMTVALNDSGAAIDAWIKPTWFDMQEPSLLKKSTDIRFFALNNQGQTISLTYYRDWNESNDNGPYSVDFSSASTKSVLKKLDITQAQSISFKIGNAVIDQDLNLTGYEIICDLIQTRDKNVK